MFRMTFEGMEGTLKSKEHPTIVEDYSRKIMPTFGTAPIILNTRNNGNFLASVVMEDFFATKAQFRQFGAIKHPS